tara:strand:+ start:29315 stop:29521 length:207 start_codon:yes stop_codon:yes gene_type:complete
MKTKVTLSNRPQVITVSTGETSPLSNLNDVNFNNATDGAVLQYDAASNTWIAENVLQKSGLQFDCGNF